MGAAFPNPLPIRVPDGSEFIRVHPEHSFRVTCLLVAWGYLAPVAQALLPKLWDDAPLTDRELRLAVTPNGQAFLWPLRLPRGPWASHPWSHDWARSAQEAANRARSHWVRVWAIPEGRCWQTFTAQGQLGETVWPSESWHDLLQSTFRERAIVHKDHPALRGWLLQPAQV